MSSEAQRVFDLNNQVTELSLQVKRLAEAARLGHYCLRVRRPQGSDDRDAIQFIETAMDECSVRPM